MNRNCPTAPAGHVAQRDIYQKGKKLMCLLMIVPEGCTITKSECKRATRTNPHGFGVGWIDEDGKPQVAKFLNKKPKAQMKLINELAETRTVVCHWRWSTGGIGLHPYIVNNSLLAHNGHCPGIVPKGGRSDTAQLAADLASAGFRTADDIAQAIEELPLATRGAGSKFVAMDICGIRIVNEQLGHWGSDGCWRSNHNHRPLEDRTKPSACDWDRDSIEPMGIGEPDVVGAKEFWKRLLETERRERQDRWQPAEDDDLLEYLAVQGDGWQIPE